MLKIVIPERRRHAAAAGLCRENERAPGWSGFFRRRAFISKTE
jgi:hypothetical protein